MTKNEFVRKLAKNTGVSIEKTNNFVNAFIETVEDTMADGEDIMFPGFGQFINKERVARVITTFDKRKVNVAARRVPIFKPGKELNEKATKIM